MTSVSSTPSNSDNFNLNYDSVKDVCGDSKQAMVYGWQHCKYTQIGEALKKSSSPIEKVFDWSLGNKTTPQEKLETLEGRKIAQFEYTARG